MRYTPLPFTPHSFDRSERFFGLGPALPLIAASQRDSLGRGLAFVLLLTISGLMLIYAPLVLGSRGDAGLQQDAPRWGVTSIPAPTRR